MYFDFREMGGLKLLLPWAKVSFDSRFPSQGHVYMKGKGKSTDGRLPTCEGSGNLLFLMFRDGIWHKFLRTKILMEVMSSYLLILVVLENCPGFVTGGLLLLHNLL